MDRNAAAGWDSEEDAADRTAEEAEREELVEPGVEVSSGTSVTEGEPRVERPAVRRSPANPDALVEGQRTGDGHELEEER